MHVAAHLTPLPDPDPVDGFVVCIWRPGAHALESRRSETWMLAGTDSVEEVIAWAREHCGDDPAEVLLLESSGAATRLWSNGLDDASTTISIPLTQD